MRTPLNYPLFIRALATISIVAGFDYFYGFTLAPNIETINKGEENP